MYALELILLCSLSLHTIFAFVILVTSQMVEQLDESIVWHVVSRVDEALTLLLHVVFLVFFEVLVESLILHWWPMSLWIQVVHVRKAHVSEIGLVGVIAYVDGCTIVADGAFFLIQNNSKSIQ